ncbi:MAG: hypothetical protein ACI9CB_003066, partial [Rhodothermales bacterium]
MKCPFADPRYRQSLILVLISLLSGLQPLMADEELLTENVILVTLDGVRIQEIFSGFDEIIAVHDEQKIYSEIPQIRPRFGAQTAKARREALMPVFWKMLAPEGIVLGNPAYDNHAKVQNKVLWSTPGYTEMMTGGPRPEVTDNDNARHPH